MVISRIFIIISLLALLFRSHLEANRSIGIVTSSTYVGDRETAWRIKIAAENLGWTAYLDEKCGKEIQHLELDWVICMLPKNNFSNPSCPNYLMVFHPHGFLDDDRTFLPFYEKYDGYLLTINDRETLADSLMLKNKKFHFVPFYPTVFEIPYQKISLNELVTMIPVWGNRRSEKRYKRLYSMLSQTGSVKFYGVHKNQHIIKEGYMGAIPFDGVSVISTLQKHGIVLVLHSNIHNENGIPSSRIFEAAAASTVIISDKNSFVKQHFGDAVFYIDASLSAEEMFNQIQAHLRTIKAYPEIALNMAKKAHDIFTEKFEMSHQLLKVEQMHNEIVSKKQ